MCAVLERDMAEGRAGALSLVPTLAELGQRERALELLGESVRRREPFVVWLATDERYDPLRELPGVSRAAAGAPARARGGAPG